MIKLKVLIMKAYEILKFGENWITIVLHEWMSMANVGQKSTHCLVRMQVQSYNFFVSYIQLDYLWEIKPSNFIHSID